MRYPERSDDTLVSLDSGTEPHWASLSGKELYYRDAQGLWAAEISFTPTVRVIERKFLFQTTADLLPGLARFGRSYAVMPDGQHFIFVSQSQLIPSTRICFVANWFEELKRLVPAEK